jgi:hypothetical protein
MFAFESLVSCDKITRMERVQDSDVVKWECDE